MQTYLNSELICERSWRNFVRVMVYWGWGIGCGSMMERSGMVNRSDMMRAGTVSYSKSTSWVSKLSSTKGGADKS